MFIAACKSRGVEPSLVIRGLLEAFLTAQGVELPAPPAQAELRRALRRRPQPIPPPPWLGEIHAVLSAPSPLADGLTITERQAAAEAKLSPDAKRRFARVRAGRKVRS